MSGTITVPEVSHELEEDEFVVGHAVQLPWAFAVTAD